MTESCHSCGEGVPFSAAVDLTVDTQRDADTFERYAYRSCYGAEREPVIGG